MTKYEKPGPKAPSYYRGLVSQGLKSLLPRINAGAPTPSSHVNSKSHLRDKLAAPTALAKAKCERYEDWLTDASIGDLTPGPDVELVAHAAECDACREAYNHARELREFADRIDGGVEFLVSGEPSPHFNSRLRARIAAEAGTPRFNWRAWTPIAAGSIALVIILIAFFTRTPRPNSPPVADNASPRTVAMRPPSAAPASVMSAGNRSPALTASVHRHITKRPGSQRVPEVLVEGGQLGAVTEFANAVRTGHVDGEKLLAAQQQANAPLEIKSMEFVPLSPSQPDVSPDAAASTPEDSTRR